MRNTAVAEIDLAAILHNLKVVRNLCPGSRIVAVVKANAYGHGLLRVARVLTDVDGLAVARLQEALALRRAGCRKRILLFPTLLDVSDLETCSEHQIDITVHSEDLVRYLAGRAERYPQRVWLKHDSGMHRTGLDSEAFARSDQLLAHKKGVLEVIHMTHFSNAGDEVAVEKQLSSFKECHSVRPDAEVSVANSAAVILSRGPGTDWVRPGLLLYGENPLPGRFSNLGLRPAMTLRSRVIAVREIRAGEAVGYNGLWISRRRSRIATIGVGYGDGYPRHAIAGTPVWINGELMPLVGQVSMDSLTVDVTDGGNVMVGDEAVLWGSEVACGVVAEHANTIPYELFTSIQRRVNRVYRE